MTEKKFVCEVEEEKRDCGMIIFYLVASIFSVWGSWELFVNQQGDLLGNWVVIVVVALLGAGLFALAICLILSPKTVAKKVVCKEAKEK